MVEKLFRVVDIVRNPNVLGGKHTFSFAIFLYHKEITNYIISSKLTDRVIKGYVFKNDFIKILQINENIIDFEVVDQESIENFDIDNSDITFKMPLTYLPFLTDTPILTDKIEIKYTTLNDNLEHDKLGKIYSILGNFAMTHPFYGKILYKSRIMTCKSAYPYLFFLILSSASEHIKLFFWRKNVKYFNSFKTNDIILVNKYKNTKKKEGFLGSLNTYGEASLFDYEELQVKDEFEIYKLDEDLLKEKTDINLENKKSLIMSNVTTMPFKKIKGAIILQSILFRKRNRLESFLILHDRIIEYFIIQLKNNEDVYNVVFFNNSEEAFYKIKPNDIVEITNLWKIQRANFIFYTSSLFTEIIILDDDHIENKDLQDNTLCFLPDSFDTYEDIENKDVIKIQNYENHDISKYFPIYSVTLAELNEHKNNLVINEHKKFMINVQLEFFDLSLFDVGLKSEGITSSFILFNEDDKKYSETGKLTVSQNYIHVDIIVHLNKFNNEQPDNLIMKISNQNEINDLEELIGKNFIFILNAFRASEEEVLVCLSQGFLIDK